MPALIGLGSPIGRRWGRLASGLLLWCLGGVFTLSVWFHAGSGLFVTPEEAGSATGSVNLALRVVLVGYALAGLGQRWTRLRVAPLNRDAWGSAVGFAVAAFLLVPLWTQGVFWLLWQRWGGGMEGYAAEAVYLEPSQRAAPWALELVIATGLALVAGLWFWRPAFRRFWARLVRPTLLASALLAAHIPLVLATTTITNGLVGRCQDPVEAVARPRPPWLLCQTLVHSLPPLGFPIPVPALSGRSALERDLGYVLWTRAFLMAQTRPHSALLAGVWEFAGKVLSLSLWVGLLTVAWRFGGTLARLRQARPPEPL